MSFDFSGISTEQSSPAPIDPIEIFQAASISDSNINDLWLAQGDALREWHKDRKCSDVSVVLNTGSGKTLVGLLIAQSLVNETSRKVLYACASIQLVEQTAEKARGYGLDTTTYVRSEFSADGYHQCVTPCVTTYQALFNGKSIFRRDKDDVVAVIFDDAHVAEHLLRDQFSLEINRDGMESVYLELVELFRSYHSATGRGTSYGEVLDGQRTGQVLWVPPFAVHDVKDQLKAILKEAKLGDADETKFSWEYICDHEDLCCILVSAKSVTLTPPYVPTSTFPYFSNDVRRVYLSATLRAPDAFARTFGRTPKLISPSTTAGECERLVLVPSKKTASPSDDVRSATTVLMEHKALVLVPTRSRGEKWRDVAPIPDREEVPQAVQAFRDEDSAKKTKLVLAGRYDGVDLPGDTCRVMVIDDLPRSSGPLERFQWNMLNLSSSLRSTIASRITQSFGRISRGMSDHGVVLITGRELVRWLEVPRNKAMLPEFLRKQIEIGYQISRTFKSDADVADAARACIDRRPDWIAKYKELMQSKTDEVGTNETETPDKSVAVDVALAEAKFINAFWDCDFVGAAKILSACLDSAYEISDNTGAWHSVWLGYALQLAGDVKSARELYGRAHGVQSNVPRMVKSEEKVVVNNVPKQVRRIVEQVDTPESKTKLLKKLHKHLEHLKGTGSPNQVEDALRHLGQYMGLESTRPDKEFGTGPDVLWVTDERVAICMEAKTDKAKTSWYKKDAIGQLNDHVQWVKDNRGEMEILPIFVGPLLPASESANPSHDVMVVELSAFEKLGKKLIAVLEDATRNAIPLTLVSEINDRLKNANLLWPDFFGTLPLKKLRDIRRVKDVAPKQVG